MEEEGEGLLDSEVLVLDEVTNSSSDVSSGPELDELSFFPLVAASPEELHFPACSSALRSASESPDSTEMVFFSSEAS